MNWLKENAFLTGLIGVTVAGLAIFGFLFSKSMTSYQETSDAYASAVQKLQSLQNRAPFPSEENLKKAQSLTEEYKAKLSTLRTELTKLKTPLKTGVQPQTFQDDLRTAVNLVKEKAAAAGVALPADFYLGFGQYANSLPSERAASVLTRELAVISDVVGTLIDFKVKSIDSLERATVAEEAAGAAPAAPAPAASPEQQRGAAGGAQARRATQPGAQETPAAAPGVTRYPFDLAFTAEQGRFRTAFNSLLNSTQFLVVRSLTVQNSNPAGPPVAQSLGSAPGGPEQPPAPAPEGGQDLNVILGKELVTATMRIEILDFPTLEEAKK